MQLSRLIYILFLGLVTMSCNQARFDKVPGTTQETIPAEIQGKYTYRANGPKSRFTDSISVDININEITVTNQLGIQTYYIKQDFLINKLNQVYVLGKPDDVIHTLYNLAILEPVSNGIRVYFMTDMKMKEGQESFLQRYMPFRDLTLNHEPVISVPSPTESTAIQTTPVVAGLPDIIRYYSVENDQLFNYFERELKDKEYVTLIKGKEDKKGNSSDVKGNKKPSKK